MPRISRASQFAPFDALKGLHDALTLKEYENEKMLKAELPEDKIKEISDTLSNLKNKDMVFCEYFNDGYKREISGKIKLILSEGFILIDDEKIFLENLYNLKIIKNKN